RRHRRPLPRSQGIPRRVLDRRRRIGRARARDRGAGVDGAWTGRQAAQHGHRSAPGHERAHGSLTDAFDPTLVRLLRDLAPQVLGVVARRYNDFSAAEDAVQEALIAAATQWPNEGIPSNPKGWLYQVAMRRLTDEVRSESARRRREESVVAEM